MGYKICPNCKTANKESIKKCCNCGFSIESTNNYINNSPSKKFPLGVITCFLAFILILLMGYFWKDENYLAFVIVLAISIVTLLILVTKINKQFLKDHPEQLQKVQEAQKEKEERDKIVAEYKKNKIKFCPHCLSTDFQYAGQQTIGARDAKTKTSYKANLNPLKPFTLVDKKEKVVRKASAGYSYDEFICMKCGKRFR